MACTRASDKGLESKLFFVGGCLLAGVVGRAIVKNVVVFFLGNKCWQLLFFEIILLLYFFGENQSVNY